jgi:hypothetical protein
MAAGRGARLAAALCARAHRIFTLGLCALGLCMLGLAAGPRVAAADPPPAAAADASPTFEWLTREPATLFDLGLLRLRLEMDKVARWLVDSGSVSGLPWSGAYYDWRNRRVIAYVTIRERLTDPTEAACRETFARIRDRLVEGVPSGPRSAEMVLETLFSHPGTGNWGRPRHLGRDLVELVRFEVVLLPPPPEQAGGPRVSCAGRLDAAPADLAMTTN